MTETLASMGSPEKAASSVMSRSRTPLLPDDKPSDRFALRTRSDGSSAAPARCEIEIGDQADRLAPEGGEALQIGFSGATRHG